MRCRCCARSAARSRPEAGAARCRSPITSAPGPARVHLKLAVRLEARAGLQRHRADARRASCRTSGSCAAIITTPGSTARSDPISGMVALMEEARAIGELAEDRLEAAAHDRLRRLGRRRAGTARLDRMGRDARRRAARERRRLHQLRLERPRLSRRRRLAHAGALRQRGRARRRRSADEGQSCWSGARAQRDRRRHDRGREGGRATRADLRLDALGSGSDYTPFLQHLGIASLNIGFGGEDEWRLVSLDLRLVRSLHALRRSRLRLRHRAGEDHRPAVLRLANADVLPFEFTRVRGDGRSLRRTR